MKRVAKNNKPSFRFVIVHKNTCKGSAEFGQTFRLGYFNRVDAERSSAHLTELGVEHKLVERKVAA
jgi:hypothetical protein